MYIRKNNIWKQGNHLNIKPIYFPFYGNLKVILKQYSGIQLLQVSCDLYINKESKYKYKSLYLYRFPCCHLHEF